MKSKPVPVNPVVSPSQGITNDLETALDTISRVYDRLNAIDSFIGISNSNDAPTNEPAQVPTLTSRAINIRNSLDSIEMRLSEIIGRL